MRLFAVLLTALSLTADPAVASETVIECPPKLLSSGGFDLYIWTLLPLENDLSGSHDLIGLSVYSGHPREMASLVPNHERPAGLGMRESTWEFAGEHWVGCMYRDTKTQLIRPLPSELKICRLRYKVKTQVPQGVVLLCRVG